MKIVSSKVQYFSIRGASGTGWWNWIPLKKEGTEDRSLGAGSLEIGSLKERRTLKLGRTRGWAGLAGWGIGNLKLGAREPDILLGLPWSLRSLRFSSTLDAKGSADSFRRAYLSRFFLPRNDLKSKFERIKHL